MHAHTNDHAPLRRALLLDAVASGAMGLLLLPAAGTLAQMLGLPAGLLRWSGVVLVPFAATLVWIARRAPAPRAAVRAVVVANLLWVLGSILLLASGAVAPTSLGTLFVVAQAAAVAVFAYLELAGLRRASGGARHPATARTESAARAASSTT